MELFTDECELTKSNIIQVVFKRCGFVGLHVIHDWTVTLVYTKFLKISAILVLPACPMCFCLSIILFKVK